jgi:hypothetical protein
MEIKMKFLVKIGLFLSAYIFLFLILTIKNYPILNLWPFLGLIVGYCMIIWALVLIDTKSDGGDYYNVLKVDNRTHESLNYLAPYLVAFLNFDLTKGQDLAVLMLFLFLIFVVYLKSDLIYTNPILALLGVNIFRIEVCEYPNICEETKKSILVLSKDDKIRKGRINGFREIDVNVFLFKDPKRAEKKSKISGFFSKK